MNKSKRDSITVSLFMTLPQFYSALLHVVRLLLFGTRWKHRFFCASSSWSTPTKQRQKNRIESEKKCKFEWKKELSYLPSKKKTEEQKIICLLFSISMHLIYDFLLILCLACQTWFYFTLFVCVCVCARKREKEMSERI